MLSVERPIDLRFGPIAPAASDRHPASSAFADWDMLLLLALILADIRVFQGSSVASFTVSELFVWSYCAPVVIGHVLRSRASLAPARARFMQALGIYAAWVLFAAAFTLVARGHSDVLQQAKNVLPAVPLAWFVLIRLQRAQTVARLANLYVLYCLAASIVAVLQLWYGGPYFRPPNENNEYKLDFAGEFVGNLVLGFCNTPNELAIVVLPGLMFSAIKLSHEVRAGQYLRLQTIACCLGCGVAFFLSQSRGAAVWFLFGLLFTVGPTRLLNSFLLRVGIVAGVITVLVIYGLHASGGTADVANTLQVRTLLWQTSLDAMTDDFYVPLLGDGIAYVKTWSWQLAGWEFPDAHNSWLDQVLFFGLPALALYFNIWRVFFRTTDSDGPVTAAPPAVRVLSDAIRASVFAFMGLYFFEPVANVVSSVSQLVLLMSCGIALASLSAGAKPLHSA